MDEDDALLELIEAAKEVLPYLDPPRMIFSQDDPTPAQERLEAAIEIVSEKISAKQPDPEGWIPGPPPPFVAGRAYLKIEHRVEVVDGKEIAHYRVLGLKSRPMGCILPEGAI